MPRGGARKGAGRKPAWLERTKRENAETLLKAIGERSAWLWAYTQAVAQLDTRTVVDILRYLTDRRDGKAAQTLAVAHLNVGGFTPAELERARALVLEIQAGYDSPILEAETIYLPRPRGSAAPEVSCVDAPAVQTDQPAEPLARIGDDASLPASGPTLPQDAPEGPSRPVAILASHNSR